MSASAGSWRICFSGTGVGRGFTVRTSTASHLPVLVGGVGVGGGRDFNDADHAGVRDGVIEEREVADRHGDQVVLRLMVPDTIPLFDAGSDLVGP